MSVNWFSMSVAEGLSIGYPGGAVSSEPTCGPQNFFLWQSQAFYCIINHFLHGWHHQARGSYMDGITSQGVVFFTWGVGHFKITCTCMQEAVHECQSGVLVE